MQKPTTMRFARVPRFRLLSLLFYLLMHVSTHAFSPQSIITPNNQVGSLSVPNQQKFVCQRHELPALCASTDDRIGKQTKLSKERSKGALQSSSKALDAYQDTPLAPEAVWSYLQTSDIATKVFNALLLAASFGFAAYTILTIDNGMTRGWTSGEIAIRLPIDNWLNYENSLADRPIFTKTAINVIIYLLGDWLSQTVFCGKNVLDFDASRTMRNGLIGLFFGPLVHEYYQFSDHILPVEGGMWNRLEKILMDQTVYLTVKCSIYIAAVGFLNGDDADTVKTNVQTKLPSIVVTAWKFWPLVHMVTYGVIPARHRILWVNCVDLIWNAILAGMSQTKESGVEETAAIVVQANESTSGIALVDSAQSDSTTRIIKIDGTAVAVEEQADSGLETAADAAADHPPSSNDKVAAAP